MSTIGKLKEVGVRELWRHEQLDFSNWLAEDENLEYLNDITGLTLVDAQKEVSVGSYRCDIVAKDETSGITVAIENQLEATNHDHLGKIITYASGLTASVIMWIVTEAKEEHRAAIEWLNNNTNDGVSFFLIELHAYKIGDSIPAPKFEVIEKPNGFIKRGKSNTSASELKDRDIEILTFWEQFNTVLANKGKPFNPRKVTAEHWYDVALGTTEAHVSISLVNKNGYITVEVYINNNKALFDRLYENKDEIERALGFPLEWNRLDKKKASRILYYVKGLDFNNHENYAELMEQSIDVAVKLRDTFKAYIALQE